MWSTSSLYHFSIYFPNSTLGCGKHKARIKITGRNINNLSYADDTTLMEENEEELKRPLDESEKGE